MSWLLPYFLKPFVPKNTVCQEICRRNRAYGHTGVTTNVALDNNTIYPIEGFEIYRLQKSMFQFFRIACTCVHSTLCSRAALYRVERNNPKRWHWLLLQLETYVLIVERSVQSAEESSYQ